MVLTGVWIAGSNVTEPHPFVSVCVCVCAHSASWLHSEVSLNTGRVSWSFAVHCPHSVLPHPALPLVRTLSRRVTGAWALHWAPRERNQQRGEHLQTGVNSTSATLKIDDVGPRFSGSQETSGPRRLITPRQDLENGVTLLLITRFIICVGSAGSFTNASGRTGSCPVL